MNDWWEMDDWPVNQQAAENTPSRVVGDSAAWTPRCRCGEPATHEIAYVWNDVEQRRARVCDVHFAAALDAPAVDGLRVLVLA